LIPQRIRHALGLGVLTASLLMGFGQTTRAYAQGAPQTTADDRAQRFEAVSGAVKEDIAGGPLMLAAYAVVWLALFGYVFRLVRLQRGLEDNLTRVEHALASSSKPAAE